jgi:SAM-dependent methyltransferase
MPRPAEGAATSSVAASYDAVADEYVERIFDELRHKPLDRELLDRFAADLRAAGPVADVGCGPGHVTRYLSERGVDVTGIDLSTAMVERARRLNPGLPFREGDMARLEVPDATWAAMVAFYSIIHIPREAVIGVLRELRRTLRPGGWLFLAFHLGTETRHLDEWWGHRVSVDFVFFETEEMTAYLRAAGFTIEEVRERDPYPDVEHPSRRAYIRARKPSEPAPPPGREVARP